MPPKAPPESLSTLLGVCTGTGAGAGRWGNGEGVMAGVLGAGGMPCTEGSTPPAVGVTAPGSFTGACPGAAGCTWGTGDVDGSAPVVSGACCAVGTCSAAGDCRVAPGCGSGAPGVGVCKGMYDGCIALSCCWLSGNVVASGCGAKGGAAASGC